MQDDIKVSSKLVLNTGLRWDYDSAFRTKTNFSPRVGFSYQDLRIGRTFTIRDRLRTAPLFEYFNLYNNANPAAIQVQQALEFGTISQRLPGRQGEAALRIEF